MTRPPGVKGEVVVLVCDEHVSEGRDALELVNGLCLSLLGGGLDTYVILRTSLPRRYGGGAGAGQQLALPLCAFCD